MSGFFSVLVARSDDTRSHRVTRTAGEARNGNASLGEASLLAATMFVLLVVAYLVLEGLAAVVLAAVAIGRFGMAVAYRSRCGSSA